MLRNGKAHTRLAQGMGTSSIMQTQRKPLVLTKCSLLERTGSINSFGGYLRPAPTFNGFIESHNDRGIYWYKGWSLK